MEIAFLSPSRYSSLEKKLESTEFRHSWEAILVANELPAASHEGTPLLVAFGILVGVCGSFWPAPAAQLVGGLVWFWPPLLPFAASCRFPSVFPPLLSSFASLAKPASVSLSPPPSFWTTLEANDFSFTSLEFWPIGRQFCPNLGEELCEEDEECRECLDSGVGDRSEWWEASRGGLLELLW